MTPLASKEQLRAHLFVNGSLLHLLVCPDETGRLEPPNRKWYWLRREDGSVIESGKGAGLVSDDYYYKWARVNCIKKGRLHTQHSGGPSIRAVALAVLGTPPRDNMVAFYAGDPDDDLRTEHLQWRKQAIRMLAGLLRTALISGKILLRPGLRGSHSSTPTPAKWSKVGSLPPAAPSGGMMEKLIEGVLGLVDIWACS